MSSRAKKLLIPVAIFAAAVLVALALINSRADLEASAPAQQLPRVKTLTVALGEVPVTIVAHGTARARYELELASEVTGRVTWVAPGFQPGQPVAAGQVLLRVDPVSYRLALAEARAALVSAENALADARALKRKAAAREAELNIEAARQRIAKAEQDLAYTEIRAPFNAVIDQQLVEFAQFISAGRTVARLLSSDTAEVSLPVPAVDAGFIQSAAGLPVVLSAQLGAVELQWQATLLWVESRLDEQARVIPVVVEVATPYDSGVHGQALPLGLFVEAVIPGMPVPDAVRLPRSAVQADDSVYILVDNTLRRRQVNIARREGDSVVVNGGLHDGDQVVVTRLNVMFEGMQAERGDA